MNARRGATASSSPDGFGERYGISTALLASCAMSCSDQGSGQSRVHGLAVALLI